MIQNVKIQSFYDQPTGTLSYLIWDESSRDAVIIDPVLNFDPTRIYLSFESMNALVKAVTQLQLTVHWVLETHVHADHLSSARELCEVLPGARWGMGARMHEVLANFKPIFGWPKDLSLAQLGVSRFFADGEEFTAGSLKLSAHSTPGHTPACMSYVLNDKVFVGDLIFQPDSGTGRCDFPAGSAAQMYDSIWGWLYALPEHFQVHVGHDYCPGGRRFLSQTTVGAEKAQNIHLRQSTSKPEFVQFRESRDKTLSAPRLLEPSLDWNLGAHRLVPRNLLKSKKPVS